MSIRPSVGALLCALVMSFAGAAGAQQYTVRDFMDYPDYNAGVISPDGRFMAMTVPEAHTTRLVVLDVVSRKVTLSTGFGGDVHVYGFWWVSPTRLVFDTVRQMGSLDQRTSTGDVYAIEYDGSKRATLWVGGVDNTHLEMLNTLPEDDDHIIVAAYGFQGDANPPAPTSWSVDVTIDQENTSRINKGARRRLTVSPADGGYLIADNTGQPRAAAGWNAKTGAVQMFWRKAGATDWTDVSALAGDDKDAEIVGFTVDDQRLLLKTNGPDGFDVLFDVDPVSGARTRISGRNDIDIDDLMHSLEGRDTVIGVRYQPELPVREFFDSGSLLARVYKVLGAAFPTQQVSVVSMTRDEKRATVSVWDGANEGDIYLLDVPSKKLEYMYSIYPNLDPDELGVQRPITLKSRDGLDLHGYLTLPKGKTGNLPLVVLAHGGPHGVRDDYGYNPEVQLFAYHGYAVLQLNFRGSGGYGYPFETAGYLHWGTTMQDDITDATNWAVKQGIADPKRMCIAGASYGGYAALMGAVREPDLYKCAFGYVGVYDISYLFVAGDTRRVAVGRKHLDLFHGKDTADQQRRSPAYNAEKIKADLLLAAGGLDKRVEIGHFRRMQAALDKAGKKYESVYQPLEGHGFSDVENSVALYTKVLAFLQRNIGGPDTRAAAPDNPPKK